jgi:formate-nitrite transporter family protein
MIHATSQLAAAKAASAPKKAAAEILNQEIREGLDVMDRSTAQLFTSALSGGLDLGFSMFLMAAVMTIVDGKIPQPITRLLVANMYSIGFIFVILGRSELFTEQTSLAVLPVLRRKATLRSLFRSWAIVYVANLLGAAIFAAMLSYIGPALGVADRAAFSTIAHRVTDHPSTVIFCSAVLAGWLMGLCSWMVVAARDTISQMAVVWMVTTTIGIGNLHHVVVGTTEVLTAIFARDGISIADFLRFLLFTTLGNAVGGTVFVAIIKYGHTRES